MDVGECQFQVLDVCLGGSWVVLTQPLGSFPSGEGWNQHSHFLTLVRGRASFPKCGGCGSPIRDSASFPVGLLVIIPGPLRGGASSLMRGVLVSSPWALLLQHMAQHVIFQVPCGNTGNRQPHRSKLQWDHGPRHGHQQQLGPGCHHDPR